MQPAPPIPSISNYPSGPQHQPPWREDLIHQVQVIAEQDPVKARELHRRILFCNWSRYELSKLAQEGLDISRVVVNRGLPGGMVEGAELTILILSGTIKFLVKGNEEEVRAKNDKDAYLPVTVRIPGSTKKISGQHMGPRALSEGRRSFGSFGSKRFKLLATGTGVFISDDLRYEGEFYNNLFHDLDGNSKLIFGDTIYRGGFKNGAMSGRCEVERYDRTTQSHYLYFKGSYDNNKPYDGTVYSSSGEEVVRYEGGELVKSKTQQVFEETLPPPAPMPFAPVSFSSVPLQAPSLALLSPLSSESASRKTSSSRDDAHSPHRDTEIELGPTRASTDPEAVRTQQETIFSTNRSEDAVERGYASDSSIESARHSIQDSASESTSARALSSLDALPVQSPLMQSPLMQSPLIQRKLANPTLELTLDESIELLTTCIRLGQSSAERISGRECVIMIGNTGAGKSTFVNYLSGCTMALKTPDELGIDGVLNLVTVLPRAEGGALDEVMAIGHTKKSKTFMPEVATDKREGLTYCDCPGFLDNRGAEINIANAVNVKNAMVSSTGAKVVVLINYYSLLAEKGRGLVETLEICSSLFGSAENIKKNKESLLLAISNVPETIKMDKLKNWLLKDTPEVMQVLVDRLFIYDPLDRTVDGAWNRTKCLQQLKDLPSIPNPKEIFKTVLTDTDEKALVTLGEQMKKEIEEALSQRDFAKASSRLQALESLGVIEHVAIDRVIDLAFYQVTLHFNGLIDEFKTCCQFEKFEDASSHLNSFSEGVSFFGKRLNDLLMLDQLKSYFSDSEQMSKDHYAREQELEAKLKDAEDEIIRLLAVLEEQRTDAEQKLAKQKESFDQLLLEKQQRIDETESDYAAIESVITQDYEERIQRKDEELRLARELGKQELNARLTRERAEIESFYRAKLELERENKDKRLEEFIKRSEAREQEILSRQKELQEKIALIEAQRVAKVTELKAIKRPSIAFGKAEWEKYFGDVGEEPPLPDNINEILNEQCSYWPKGRWYGTNKVKNTHLLVLIPKTVDGKPLTLNFLGELVQRPRSGGYATKYDYYNGDVKAEFGESGISSSYWILMSKDVIPNSRSKSFEDQCKLVKLADRVPKVLEALTAVLMHHVRSGERLYSDSSRTYSRCEEVESSTGYRLAIGGFGSGGLFVSSYYDDGSGVAVSREF